MVDLMGYQEMGQVRFGVGAVRWNCLGSKVSGWLRFCDGHIWMRLVDCFCLLLALARVVMPSVRLSWFVK